LIAAAALAIWGLQPGIEFTSGSSFQLQFNDKPVAQEDLRSAMHQLGPDEPGIQGSGSNQYIIRTNELQGAPEVTSTEAEGPAAPAEGSEIDKIQSALQERFGSVTRMDYSTLSGAVAEEIARNATLAVIAESVAILIYISLAFRRLPRPWR